MKITRQIVAEKITDYLHGKLGQAELVDWAERAMMDAGFDQADMDLLTDIVGRLGLADVAEFGLRWQDCEEFLRRLGYKAKVIVSAEASASFQSPIRVEPQEQDRYRFWAKVGELQGRFLRVVTLSDKMTIHN